MCVSLLPVGQLRHQDVGFLLAQQAELPHLLLVHLDIATSVNAMPAGAEEVVEEGLGEDRSLDQVG